MIKIKHKQAFAILIVLCSVAYFKLSDPTISPFADWAINSIIVLILLGFGEVLLLSIIGWAILGSASLTRVFKNFSLLSPSNANEKSPC
jgi:hypothetical protein